MNYIDEIILHSIAASEEASDWANDVLNGLKELLQELKEICISKSNVSTKKSLNNLKSVLQERISIYESSLENIAVGMIDNKIESEVSWIENTVSEELGVNLVMPDNIRAILLKYPMATCGSIEDFSQSIATKVSDLFTGILVASYATGTPLEDIIENSEPRFNTLENTVYYDSETINENTGNVYDRIVYTKNEEKISKFMWSAILDTSTCDSCGYLNGKVFKDISKIPLYPMHRSCRCTLIPLVDGIDYEIPHTYTEWLENQNEETKKKVLGKTRYSMYKDGTKISKFYAKGKKIRLDKLKI